MSELNQCPCNPACKCLMGEPCYGCEEYGKWLNTRQPDQELVDALEAVMSYTKFGTGSINSIRGIAGKALGKYKQEQL